MEYDNIYDLISFFLTECYFCGKLQCSPSTKTAEPEELLYTYNADILSLSEYVSLNVRTYSADHRRWHYDNYIRYTSYNNSVSKYDCDISLSLDPYLRDWVFQVSV